MRRRQAAHVVFGLDLSLTGAAAVAMPFDWCERRDWSEVKWKLYGYKLEKPTPREEFERVVAVAMEIADFVGVHSATASASVFVEQYAFAQGMSHARAVAELGGVVRWLLMCPDGQPPIMWSRLPTPIVASSARKLLCGHVPMKSTSGVKPKDFVFEFLRRAGAPFSSKDVADAFVVANAGLAELGAPCLSVGDSD